MARILILDDQRCIRYLISEELRFEGYKTCGVENPERMRNQLVQFKPDLVLLDLFLDVGDGTDGFSELQYIKRQYPRLPVIIFTAYDTFRDDSRLSQADGYILKSTDFRILKQKIADVLSERQFVLMGYEKKVCFKTCNVLTT